MELFYYDMYMSGQPNKGPMDASKFREQYMANLALQAENDDKNLQANKVYKRTGQLPMTPMDTRTTSEKLGDLMRIRIEVQRRLQECMDSVNANKVVTQLSGDELQYVANHIESIVADTKAKYGLGALAEYFYPIFVFVFTTMKRLKAYPKDFNKKAVQLS